MQSVFVYLTTFLEGILSFISPCMLPMLPIYVSFFARGNGTEDTKSKSHTFIRALSFVLGFTVVFSILGILAGSIGGVLTRYDNIVNAICGIIVIIFGLSYLEIVRLPFFKGAAVSNGGGSILSAFIFGIIFSVNLTPCIGAFLGSALILAQSSGTALTGFFLLLLYSLGLGIPFLAAAMLLEKMRTAIGFIKKHYKIINTVCGIFLIIIGLTMIFGVFGRFVTMLA